MARIEFGHTWWGHRWLDALAHIDFGNRLPRGKRYARNGSVASISIEGTRISARVKGTRPTPYRVGLTLWEFSALEQETIIGLVKDDPYYLSQLEARRLPPELEGVLAERGIRLFPESWKELGMTCSCPDWAVPCKHLAAVVYIVANEIDKNPFLVFPMHGLDLLEAIHGGPLEDNGKIVGIESLVAEGPVEYTSSRESLEELDLAAIPDLYPATAQLLTEFPLFYLEGDFRELLLGAIRRAGTKATRHISLLDIQEESRAAPDSRCTMTIRKGHGRVTGRIGSDEDEVAFDSDDFSPCVEYLQRLSAGDLSVYPPMISFLIMSHNFALRLLERHAIVPELISVRKDTFLIRWIPALFNSEVAGIFDGLVGALPGEVLRYDRTPLTRREQLLFLISFFLRHYLRLLEPVKNAGDHPIRALFFQGDEYRPTRFEEQGNAQTIHLWLGRFSIRPIHHYPVIRVEEGGQDTFKFEVLVGDRREAGSLPVSFALFLEQLDPETLPLLRDLSLLSTYLGTVNTFLKEGSTVTVCAGDFLEEWFGAIPALRTLGVRTVVPKALREVFQPHLTLGLRKRPDSDSDRVVSYTSLKDMLAVDWHVAVGDEVMPAGELFELSQRYRRFVRYKDRFIELDEARLAQISRKMARDPRPRAVDLLQIGLTGTYEGAPIAMSPEARTLFDQLLNAPEAEVPPGLRAELRPYQLRGYQWLYHNYRIGLGAVVADDMGLGKTIQVIAFLLKLQEESALRPNRPALAVVPASVVTNWERELHRFAPSLATGIYHGSDRTMPSGVDVVLTTYALLRGDMEHFGSRKWSVLIIDEAQNIKNTASAQARAVKALKAGFSIAMTGTPVENRLLDYWSIIDFAMKGYLGTRASFKERYAVPIERFRDQTALEHFRTVTAPLVLRRLKTDRTIIDDLPEKIVINRYPLLTGEQMVLYRELVERTEEFLGEAEGIERSGMVFKLMTGLKQICCHPHLYAKRGERGSTVSGKAKLLTEQVQTIAARGEKVLIFTQFAEMGWLLQEMIDAELHLPCLFLHGGSSRRERDALVDRFQNDPTHQVMVLSIRAGGVGLNLTAANHVIHYDLWWNPAVEHQATDRAFRIGQRKDVMVYRFITGGTFEEKISAMLEAKEDLAELTVAHGEKWLTHLSTTEIRDLIGLTGEG
ncbi:hypothetical protein AU468_11430 [Alkalispirochaeta sphaeroplastigenens]|uniref:Helicase SNF2 n=1 Tax=Alkalispirochaeta sphaeroplastigenens TaxID=1187066 RepID=A0A2S4JHK5_9SPIO|nr:SNF2-related protein [Alkalispirochaeta sphaeroplastigenens]POQ98993.1 hypothetical protein AU468_11430 [Alkalispirochaeta sphaeroplastigenens]